VSQAIVILYATRNGYTRHIAERLVCSVKARGFESEIIDTAHLPPRFSLQRYAGAMLAAPVHAGSHEREMVDFVKLHKTELEKMPAAFLSVSLSEAGMEDKSAPLERRARASEDVERMIHKFLAETGWHPPAIKAVAGALLYTKYGFLVRFVMKRIAKAAGGSTDTSKDHEYTDWTALDHFADDFLKKEAALASC
jgi:menaquinone-dependent protoporphyrinogen oxidase